MKTDYEKQAEEFLKETQTEFKAEFIKHDFYFSDDKDKRDIYQITLKRGNREYSFTFGQSIFNSRFNITLKNGKEFKPLCINEAKEFAQGDIKKFKQFINSKITLVGLNISEGTTPTPYDVLACLTTNDPEDFEWFCSCYGYDTDSRKTEEIYKAVVDEYNNLKMLYNDEELEKLAEIQ